MGDFKMTLDLFAKFEVESGLDNMSGIKPLAILVLFLCFVCCLHNKIVDLSVVE